MIAEEGLADLFEGAVRDVDPAAHAIVGRAEHLGRRLRTRLRVWMALGSCLVVAALAGTALAAGVPLAHHPGARVAPAALRSQASATPARTRPASPKPSDRSSSPRPPGRSYPAGGFPQLAPGYQMTIRQMLHVLRSLLPAGSTVSIINAYSAADGSLEVDYNDGRGAVDHIIGIDPTATYSPLSCPPPLWTDEGQRPAGALPISCAMRTLPGGGIERDAVMYADAYGFYGYNIYDQRPDRITVLIQGANGINHTLPQVDRARPPGSMREWEAGAHKPPSHLSQARHPT